MPDLKDLSPAALSAAMRGGTDAWGQHGSAADHVRYSEPLPKRPGARKKCHCGCGGRDTHIGMANGVGLAWGCELHIRRWVKDGPAVYVRRPCDQET